MDDTALRLNRGITVLFGELGLAALSEFPLSNGRRADLVAVDAQGEIVIVEIVIVEIKSSRTDFVSDRKWWEYRDFCDRFFFGVAADFPQELLPRIAGCLLPMPMARRSSGRRPGCRCMRPGAGHRSHISPRPPAAA